MNFHNAFIDELVKVAGARREGRILSSIYRAELAGRPPKPGLEGAAVLASSKVGRRIARINDPSLTAARLGQRDQGFAPILHPQHYYAGKLINQLL